MQWCAADPGSSLLPHGFRLARYALGRNDKKRHLMGPILYLRTHYWAKRYAAELRPTLVMILGERKYYTTCQIKAVSEDLGLNLKFLVLGYACFLPRDRFETEKQGLKVPLTYTQARAVMAKYMPTSQMAPED